jgi:hypothetical protein
MLPILLCFYTILSSTATGLDFLTLIHSILGCKILFDYKSIEGKNDRRDEKI